MPLGTDTPTAYGLLVSLRGKIDQYFAQCRAVALDPQMARQIGPRLAELESLDFGDPGIVEDVLKKAPLARPRPSRALSFADQIITIDRGRIIESGTHSELMENDRYYAKTYRFQEIEEEYAY